MANTDQARGFVPVGHLTGGEIRPRAYILDNESSAIYKGDLVSMTVETGQVTLSTADDQGLVVGVAAESKNSTDVADDDTILLWDDPRVIFEVQGVTGTTFNRGQIGQTFPHVVGTADTTYKISRAELNAWAGGNDQFFLLGKVDRPGNEWGEHVKLLVVFNNHKFLTAATS